MTGQEDVQLPPEPKAITPKSPPWTNTVKIIVALVLLVLTGALLYRFQYLVPPVLIAMLLAFLFYPSASWLKDKLHIPWGLASAIVVLLLAVFGGGLLAVGGIAIFDQILSLIRFLQNWLQNLPNLVDQFIAQPRYIWNYQLDFSGVTLDTIVKDLQTYIGPIFNRSADIIGVILRGAATSFGSIVLVLMIMYFVLADSKGAKKRFRGINIPGYEYDGKRIGLELGKIWNSFLRGQLIIVLLTIIIYAVLLLVLRVNYFLGLAVLAGLARFIPYVGPTVAWTTYGLVSLFQGTTIFGLESLPYALMVVGVAMVVDFFMDNAITPKIMGSTLNVHPAAIMIAALVFASLFGVIGVMLAAPVLATVQLFVTYAVRKLLDQDPWSELDKRPKDPQYFGWRKVRRWFIRLGITIKKWLNGLKSKLTTKSTGG